VGNPLRIERKMLAWEVLGWRESDDEKRSFESGGEQMTI